MAEPSRSDPDKRLSNFVRTAPSFVSRREEFALNLAPFLSAPWETRSPCLTVIQNFHLSGYLATRPFLIVARKFSSHK
jgi:hypothetical protein